MGIKRKVFRLLFGNEMTEKVSYILDVADRNIQRKNSNHTLLSETVPVQKKHIMGDRVSLASPFNCTGCGACANICPKNSIEMKPDKEGFIVPIINKNICVQCHLCEKTCPVLNPQYYNAQPICYAVKASDAIRAKSSSGGVFTLVAEEILSRGGVVFGAAWTRDWHVQTKGVTSAENLDELRRSKYVESETGFTYREVKQSLESGKPVLYTGRPCQIAGLYSYLGGGKIWEELYTAEVICHGVPSYKALEKYLRDEHGFEKITKIDFRNKNMIPSTSTNIYFDNGNEYHKLGRDDHYFQAFLPCMSMRNSCSVCPFSRLPRQADITMGDFWGADRYKRGLEDNKGLSAVLINSRKGEKLFESVSNQMTFKEKIPLDAITFVNKTVVHPFVQHPGRKHFYSALDLKPFGKLVSDSLEHKYDVGIVGLWYGINYGSILTYYALYSLLREFGYDAVLLPRPNSLWKNDAPRFDDKNSIAQSFIWKHCNVFQPVSCDEEFYIFNDLCRDFIVGSDVVWKYNVCGKDVDQFFFLDWVESGHKKIAFASSCGNELTGPDVYRYKAIQNLKKFDALSSREEKTVSGLKSLCSREDFAQVLDPVFLCDRQVYDEIISEAYLTQTADIFCYLLRGDNSTITGKIFDQVKSFFNTDSMFLCINPNEINLMRSVYPQASEIPVSVAAWLAYISNSKFYIGNSYHGLCFALIFHVPFIILFGKELDNGSEQRFVSLLKIVGLSDRIIFSFDNAEREVDVLLKSQIDWTDVDARLELYRSFSRDWLRYALQKPAQEVSMEQKALESEQRKGKQRIVNLENKINTMRKEAKGEL